MIARQFRKGDMQQNGQFPPLETQGPLSCIFPYTSGSEDEIDSLRVDLWGWVSLQVELLLTSGLSDQALESHLLVPQYKDEEGSRRLGSCLLAQ